MKLVIKFKKEKETSGAIRYQEVDDSGTVIKPEQGAKIGTQYIRKAAFTGAVPASITVTIEGSE